MGRALLPGVPVSVGWDGGDPLPRDPLPIVAAWLTEAFAAKQQANPHAVALASLDARGRPAVRMVLCQHVDPAAGRFLFYTDRTSRKGRELDGNPHAALAFYWGPQGRQVRVEGVVSPTDDADGDAYFAGRPRESQLGAWASDQSQPIASRAALHARLAEVGRRFPAAEPVPRPARWGGYALRAEQLELWISGPGRIHDRARFVRGASGDWSATRLQP